MADNEKDTTTQDSGEVPTHPGGGPVPGRTRRRGALPGGGGSQGAGMPGAGGGGKTTLPVGAPLDAPAAPAAEDGDLTFTAKQKLPDAKVLGLRMSERHYDTGNTMIDVLATKFRLDKRQVGELVIQFLVNQRFNLYNYVQQQVGPAPVDLDFFSPDKQPQDLDASL